MKILGVEFDLTPYLIIIILLCVIGGGIFYIGDQNRKMRERLRQKETIITEQNAEIKYRKNKEGQLIAEKEIAEANVKAIAAAYPLLEKELSEQFDIKIKNLKAYIKNEFEARGSGTSTVTNNYYDSSTHQSYRRLNFNDGYLSFKSFIDSTNNAISTYTYSDTITTVLSGKKTWFLGTEKLYATSKFNNPAAKISGSTNILVKDHKDKRFVISAGIYGDPILRSWGVGLHFGYALIKF
jgi:hypothetical protein